MHKKLLILLVAFNLSACGKSELDQDSALHTVRNGNVTAITTFDLDGDGKPEIIFGQGGNIYILKNEGGLKFVQVTASSMK